MRAPLVLIALLLVLAALAGGCADPDAGPVARLAAAIPDEVVAADGMVLRAGADGAAVLVADLGLDPVDVAATATTGTPALRVLLADPDGVAARLLDAGFREVEAPPDWILLERSRPPSDGFVGTPAVALGPELVATGDVAQLRALAGGGPPVPLPADALEGAAVAHVLPGPLDAPGLPPAVAAAATATAGAAGGGPPGRLVLVLDGPGSQQDAVDLSVRLRTEGPRDVDGQPSFEVGGALTDGATITTELVWRDADLARAGLAEGLAGSPLVVLADR